MVSAVKTKTAKKANFANNSLDFVGFALQS
jgi:hypothetical protein